MKNRITHVFLSAFIGLMMIGSVSTYAQANYAGGQGGGYSSTTIGNSTLANLGDSLEIKTFDANIYPNPLTSSQTLKARITGIQQGEKVQVIVTNMIGSRILSQEFEVTNEISIEIPKEKLSKGIYLITFKHLSKKVTRRFSFSS